MQPIACCKCGIDFGLTDGYYEARRADHRHFYCPNGHRQHFSQESKEEWLARALNESYDDRDHLQHQLAGMKGAFRKAQKRAKQTEVVFK
jgi:hypothetical protein